MKDKIKKLLENKTHLENVCIATEEPAELIQAISKMERVANCKKGSLRARYSLMSEMADVTIVLEMLKTMYNISDEELEIEIENKMKKNLERIK